MGTHRSIPLLISAIVSTRAFALEPVSPPGSPITVYQTELPYGEVRENLELGITGQGLLLRDTLHIGDMLQRTAGDTGLQHPAYAQAESLEFCSIALTYRMTRADPANIANCPLTISLYTLPGKAGTTYLSYREPALLGDANEAAKAISKLLRDIVTSALEF